MAESTFSHKNAKRLGKLRLDYESLRPSAELLQRVETRLTNGSSGEVLPKPLLPRTLRSPRLKVTLLFAALTLGGLAWAHWHGRNEPTPVPSEGAPESVRPSLPATLPQTERRRKPVITSRKKPVPLSHASVPRQEFFAIEVSRGRKHSGASNKLCQGTWSDQSIFPGLGFSASPLTGQLIGAYTCEAKWNDGSNQALSLQIARQPAPLIGCESRRGIRIPLSVQVRLEEYGLNYYAVSSALLQSPTRYSLSFRSRRVWRNDSEGVVPYANSLSRGGFFSFMTTASPLTELSEHGVLQANVTAKLLGNLSRGELTCRKTP